jgi:hypothetical protein
LLDVPEFRFIDAPPMRRNGIFGPLSIVVKLSEIKRTDVKKPHIVLTPRAFAMK